MHGVVVSLLGQKEGLQKAHAAELEFCSGQMQAARQLVQAKQALLETHAQEAHLLRQHTHTPSQEVLNFSGPSFIGV